jgi:DNA-binding transcriptional MerR regulator
VIKPHKAGSLQRFYRKKDLDLILRIKKLLYEDRFTIAGAKRKIRDLEEEERRGLGPKPAGKGPGEEERGLLSFVREELMGIREMLEGSSLPS